MVVEALAHVVTGFFDWAIAQYLGVLLVLLQDVGHPAYFFVETIISHIYSIVLSVRAPSNVKAIPRTELRLC